MDDEPHVVVSASRWKRGCAFCVAACLLVTVVVCPLGIIGVRRGAVSPPWFDRTLGTLRLVGYSTWNADCPPYTGCAPTRREAYVVWLITDHNTRAYQLIRLTIVHALSASHDLYWPTASYFP